MHETEKVSGSGSRACMKLRKSQALSIFGVRGGCEEHFWGQRSCERAFFGAGGCERAFFGREAVKEHFWEGKL